MLFEKGSYKDKSSTEYFWMNVCLLKIILYFDRIEFSEVIDINKTSASK